MAVKPTTTVNVANTQLKAAQQGIDKFILLGVISSSKFDLADGKYSAQNQYKVVFDGRYMITNFLVKALGNTLTSYKLNMTSSQVATKTLPKTGWITETIYTVDDMVLVGAIAGNVEIYAKFERIL